MAYIKFVERTLTCKYKDNSTYEDLLRYCGNPEKAVAAGTLHLESLTTAAAEMQCTAQQFHKDYGTPYSAHHYHVYQEGNSLSVDGAVHRRGMQPLLCRPLSGGLLHPLGAESPYSHDRQ